MQYLDGLNERQKEAVLTTDGPLSVLAGAGSGKTRVLTTRIYHLIRQGIPADRILAVTFTNKAAREMRERLAARMQDSPMPFISTFHGLGRELLQTYGSTLGIPRFFSIFDRDDSERAIKEALKRMDIDPKEVPPRAILARISKAKSEGMTASEFKERGARDSFRNRITADAWVHYQNTLAAEKALDFDDLISLPVRLLETNDEVRAQVQERFHYVHIDEYQDTNELQGRLADLLAGSRRNLFVVGDIDQTIYTWRGATIDNLLAFDKTYPNAKTIVLEQNYRSSGTIVDAANQIIQLNRNRKEKVSTTENPDGERIVVAMLETAEAEAAWVAREARARMQEGTNAEEIAVLFRTNFQSRALEEAFLRAGVPYRLLGTRFFDRKEVKDVLSWVRLALEPSREADRVRAVQSPSRGIGKITLGKVMAGKRNELRAGEKAKIEQFEAVVSGLAQLANTAAPSDFVRAVIERSGYGAALERGGEDDQERLENIKELATFASRYDGTPGREGIASFLADAALASDQDEMDRSETKRGVTLMTVHAAKGLEFEAVFVTGLEEGLFPHEGQGDENERDEEEERRLFYVAVTRAKQRLYLTLARVRRIYGADYFSEPSSFLRDIDPAIVAFTEPNAREEASIYI